MCTPTPITDPITDDIEGLGLRAVRDQSNMIKSVVRKASVFVNTHLSDKFDLYKESNEHEFVPYRRNALAMSIVIALFNIPHVSINLWNGNPTEANCIIELADQLAKTHKRAAEFQIAQMNVRCFEAGVPYEYGYMIVVHIASGNKRQCEIPRYQLRAPE